MAQPQHLEIEVKLQIDEDLREIRRLIRAAGFRVAKKRVFESNKVFDTETGELRQSGRLLRLREIGTDAKLTYKGVSLPGKHKSREELESGITNASRFELILSRLGYRESFRYEKFRTEFENGTDRGVVTLDETPIGNFLEIEGRPRWIDQTAKELGFSAAQYITKSYGSLYMEYCRDYGVVPANMVFTSRQKRAIQSAGTR